MASNESDSRSKLIRSFLQSGESNSSFAERAPSIFSNAPAPNSPRLTRARSALVGRDRSRANSPARVDANTPSTPNFFPRLFGSSPASQSGPHEATPLIMTSSSASAGSSSSTQPTIVASPFRRSMMEIRNSKRPSISGNLGSTASPPASPRLHPSSTPNALLYMRGPDIFQQPLSTAGEIDQRLEDGINSPIFASSTSYFAVPVGTPRSASPMMGRGRALSEEDFTTVDWTREDEREKSRKRELRASKATRGCLMKVVHFFLSGQGWLLLALIGAAVGTSSALVQLLWTWLDSIRQGYCVQNIFLHQAACCGVSIITGGSAVPDSALHPPQFSTAPFSPGDFGNSSGPTPAQDIAQQLGSMDCGYFRTWVQVYRSWTQPSDSGIPSPDSGGGGGDGPDSGGGGANGGGTGNSGTASADETTFWTGASPGFWFAYAIYVFSGMLMAVTGVWLVVNFASFARASGLPEIKTVIGGVVMKKFLGAWTLFIKLLGTVLAVSAGLIVGVEGPFIHISCCAANIISRCFPKFYHNEAKKREILAAAASAGVAVAFGAPVGGVLFSLEELSSYFPHKTLWRSFFCAVTSILAVAFVDPLQTGQLVWFKIQFKNTWLWFEMIPFCVLGILGGLVGGLMIKLNMRVARLLETTRWGQNPLLEVALVAAVTNLIRFPFVLLRGSTYHFLSALFSDCRRPDMRLDQLCSSSADPWWSIALLVIFGTLLALLVCFTFGSWIPGGIFVPALLIGACYGRALGLMIATFYNQYPNSQIFSYCSTSSNENCITPGIYALVGAAAVLGGVTRMTVSLAVIMFELTGGLNYALPLVSAIMFAKWFGDAFSKDSIHDKYIALYQFPHLDHKINVPTTNISARDVMTQNLVALTMHGHTIESLREILRAYPFSGFPVVTTEEEMLLVGYTRRNELIQKLDEAEEFQGLKTSTRCYFAALEMRFPRNGPFVDLSSCMDSSPVQVVDRMSFERVFHMFRTLGLGYCLITKFGKLVGVLTKKDILAVLKASD